MKCGMKVIADLHVVRGSHNGNDHSGTRDGFQQMGRFQYKGYCGNHRLPSKKVQ